MQLTRNSLRFAALPLLCYAPVALAHGDFTVIYVILFNFVTVVVFLALLASWRTWLQRGIVSAYFFAGLAATWLVAVSVPATSDNLLPKVIIVSGPFIGWLVGWYKAQRHPRRGA